MRLLLLLAALPIMASAMASAGPVTCAFPLAEYKFGGANMGMFAALMPGQSTKPAVFPCEWPSGRNMWVKFSLAKGIGPLDEKDELAVYMLSSVNCNEGTRIDVRNLPPKSMLCQLNEADKACESRHYLVSEVIDDPIQVEGCVVAFCKNLKIQCTAEVMVEFFERMFFWSHVLCLISLLCV